MEELLELVFCIDGYIWLNWLLLALLLVVAIALILQRDLLVGTLLMCFFSLMLAAIHLVLNAPDVAFTEAAVGAGISTILFLGALLITGYHEKQKRKIHWPALIMCLILGVLLLASTAEMPHFGSADTNTYKHLATYYVHETKEQVHIPNIVTAILGSYRGYDTMGEVLVTFTAAMCVLLVMGDFRRRPQKPEDDQ